MPLAWPGHHYPKEEIWYTDDTQMAIGVAETLISCGEIDETRLCTAFTANYVPSRGYGRGARAVIQAMKAGRDYREIAEHYFPGGSYGNGAAMRVAPVGLVFRNERDKLWHQALRDLRVPFGGMKQSGVGREGGEEALRLAYPRAAPLRFLISFASMGRRPLLAGQVQEGVHQTRRDSACTMSFSGREGARL